MVSTHLNIMLAREVPQCSILGPVLFIYINDLPNDLSSNCKLFADDKPIFSVANNIHTSATTLSHDLNAITNWTFQWKMIFNPEITKKLAKLWDFYAKFNQILPRLSFLAIDKTLIRSGLHFTDIICDQVYNSAFHDKLESVQYNAYLAITSAIRGTSTEKIYQELGLESVKSRR